MKKAIIVLGAVIMLLYPSLSKGNVYIGVGGGAGGEAEGASASLDFGFLSEDLHVNLLVGAGMGIIFTAGDELPSGTLDYPCPDSDLTDMDTYRLGAEIPFFAKFGFEIFKEQRIFLFGIGGGSMATNEVELAQSNITGLYYEQSRGDELYILYGGGLGYYKRFMLQVGYDNRRGFTGSIGLVF